jgi:hypothetical protein
VKLIPLSCVVACSYSAGTMKVTAIRILIVANMVAFSAGGLRGQETPERKLMRSAPPPRQLGLSIAPVAPAPAPGPVPQASLTAQVNPDTISNVVGGTITTEVLQTLLLVNSGNTGNFLNSLDTPLLDGVQQTEKLANAGIFTIQTGAQNGSNEPALLSVLQVGWPAIQSF